MSVLDIYLYNEYLSNNANPILQILQLRAHLKI